MILEKGTKNLKVT